MSFGCTIMAGKEEITAEDFVGRSLFRLGPSRYEHTDAPYTRNDFCHVVASCRYGDKHKEAAQDAFRELQAMAKDNLDSLREIHCCTCKCEPKKPIGWDRKILERLLAIDPKKITYLYGGY